MGTDELIQLIVLIIFLLISPFLQRLRQRRAPAPAPEPGAPAPGPIVAPDYAVYLVRTLKDYRQNVLELRARAAGNPLLQLPEVAPVAEALLERAKAESKDVVRRIDAALEEDDAPPSARAAQLSRVVEEVREDLAQIRALAAVLSSLTEQRLNPARQAHLERVDAFVGALTAGADTAIKGRRRWTVLWSGDPALPSTLVGPRPVGLVSVPQAPDRRASAWVHAARGVGFDVLAQFPALVPRLRAATLVGPLAEQSPVVPYYARATFDMATALSAWAPNLTADLIGAALLGRTYAAGVVHSELGRGLQPQQTATILTEGGLYHPEPPLLVRLAVIDEVLRGTGWAEADDGLGLLAQRIALPSEALYVLPNRLTRRLRLDPLLDYMRQAAEALLGQRFEAIGERRLADLVGSALSPVDDTQIHTARRTFLAGKLPVQPPLILVCGAVLAEIDEAAKGRSFATLLTNALDQRPRRRVRRPRAATALSDRLLVRDALVLSEIL